MLAESRKQGPTVTEIFGGIGYIIGLMGIAAYFKNRRKN
jgi:nickel transport protein